MNELKACPFCGGEGKLETMLYGGTAVSCQNTDCGFYGFNVETSMWNTRPNDAKNPDGVQMIKSYLESNGFDGLYTDECGCELSDLMPCGGDFAVHCQAGYKTVGDFEFDGEKCDWFIGKDKPKQSREGEEG